MNVIVLSGFLGSGKTSLLLQLSAHLSGGSECDAGSSGNTQTKVAILENEIGTVSVDGATLRSQGIEVRELFSGCVCCSLRGELAVSLLEIETKVQPDWLIMEATGLAFPDKTAEVIRDNVRNLGSLKIIVLVDADHFLDLDKLVPLVSGQPKFANLLLLNKIDLVNEERKKQTITRLREINANAPLLEIVATQPLPNELWQEVLR